MEVATVFESEKFQSEELGTPFSELYPIVKAFIQEFCKNKGCGYDGDKGIIYNTVNITFYLNYSPFVKRYFLCFIPTNIWKYSTKTVLQPAFNSTVDFYKMMPDNLDLNGIKFTKSKITGELDISTWTYATKPDIGTNKIADLSTTGKVRSIGQQVLEKRKKSIKQKLLVIDAAGIVNQLHLRTLVSIISPLFVDTPQVIQYNDKILELIEGRADKNNLFIMFFGTHDNFEKCYRPYKAYFISNGIPSQFLTVENYNRTTQWGVENLTFEIIKKASREDAIIIDSIPKIDVDGFLCLSDIESMKSGKLFGISVSFTGRGTTEDWLEIYNDINYVADKGRISFEENALTRLSEKIEALADLKGKKIDVYVTKRWKITDVGYLTRLLESNGITVRKFIHMSIRTNRFLFSGLENEQQNLLKHPYILWDDRVASIQTNSKIQLYGTMFPVYLELLNPWTSGKLSEDDLKIVLWLTKKRIYRIMNFFNLKVPELLTLFDQARDLNITNITGKLRISIHTLI
jgi:hypothetical protein